MMKNSVTIYDIAKEASVSVSTVSRVLTGNAPVRSETRKKVMAIIEKYNYRPNSLARSLLNKQSKMIGIVLPDITNPFFSTLVFKSEVYSLKMGYTTFLCNAMNDYNLESEYLQNLLEKRVEGIIFLGGRINQTNTDPEYAEEMNQVMEHVPVVFVNGKMEGVDAHVVRTDEAYGVHKLVELLMNHGHHKIGIIGGRKGISSTDLKQKAFKEALQERGIKAREEWILNGDFTIESGEELASSLFNQKELPTAIIGINDFVAAGAIKMCYKFGLEVPKDISVVGFDDNYLAGTFPPGITTVSQNYELLAETAVHVLMGLIKGEEVDKETIIPTKLVVRNSS